MTNKRSSTLLIMVHLMSGMSCLHVYREVSSPVNTTGHPVFTQNTYTFTHFVAGYFILFLFLLLRNCKDTVGPFLLLNH